MAIDFTLSRQLHDIMRHPGYDSMLAARGEGLPDAW